MLKSPSFGLSLPFQTRLLLPTFPASLDDARMGHGHVSACALTSSTFWNALLPDGWESSSSFLKALFEFHLLPEGLDLHPPGILSLPFPRAPWTLLPAHLLFILPSLLWDHKQQGSWDTPLFILLLNGMMDDSMVLGVTFQLLLPEAGLDSGPCKQERHGCAGSVLGGQCGFCRGSAHTHTLHPCVPHPSPQRGAKVPVGLRSFLDLGPGPLPFFLFPSFSVSNFIPSHGCS